MFWRAKIEKWLYNRANELILMAKKIHVSKIVTHRQCKHCREINYEFLSHLGQPIMGECVYSEKRFLLNEKTDCKQFK